MKPLPEVVYVRMGQLAKGEGNLVLKATLGSCVGIAMWWPEQGRAALAHCLLPSSFSRFDEPGPPTATRGPAFWVDTAVPALLDFMGAPPGQASQVLSYLGGGAQLSPVSQSAMRIGELNICAAKQAVHQAGVRLIEVRESGNRAMRVSVDCWSGQVNWSAIEPPAPFRPVR